MGVDQVATMAAEQLYTVAEVADMMRVSRMTVYRMVHAGVIPSIRFGRSYRVPKSAVRDYLEELNPGMDYPID